MPTVASFHLATFPWKRSISRFLTVPAERWELSESEGCVLGKVMATSKPGTTRFGADITRWAVFAVWTDEQTRQAFIDKSPLMERWSTAARSLQHFYLSPIDARGTWGGVDPFPDIDRSNGNSDQPVAVLTRATVRPQKMLAFARSVGAVDDALKRQKGSVLALGIGEFPVVHQATFSVWESEAAVRAFAYEGAEHANVIRRTHQENWFGEELFARFRVTSQ